jgi:SAM-dependent methyltransferase
MEDWWLGELGSDPAYEEDVTPLVLDLADTDKLILDVGCGEGRLMRTLSGRGADVVGIDILPGLLMSAAEFGDVVLGRLPDLSMFGDGVFDGAVISLVLEHIEDHAHLLRELARIVKPGGSLALVVNHPTYTAPGSAPIQDGDDVLWRTGQYLSLGHTDEPAGDHQVRFHHRPMGVLLSDAADAGWDLRIVTEFGVSAGQIEANPMLAMQRHIPRLLGCRWTRR